MTTPSITTGLPNNLVVYPNRIYVPYELNAHINGQNQLSASGSLNGSQLLSPLLLTTGGTQYTLPTANVLQDAFGSFFQIQTGDVLLLKTVSLTGAVGTNTFVSNPTGGSGIRVIPAYSAGSAVNNLCVQFTATSDSTVTPNGASYVLF